MNCPKCGVALEQGARFCVYCGTCIENGVEQKPLKLETGAEKASAGNAMKRFCNECGAPLRDNVRFCTKCGLRIKRETGSANAQNKQTTAAQETVLQRVPTPQLQTQKPQKTDGAKNTMRQKGILAAVVCVIVIGIAAVVFAKVHSARQARVVQEAGDIFADMEELEPQPTGPLSSVQAQETQSAMEAPFRTDMAENTVEREENEPKQPQIIQLDARYIRGIEATSELTDSTKTYQAEDVLDSNRETCWCEGADGTGAGEMLVVEFTQPVYLTEVAFLNGYLKNETVYNNNGKIKRAELETEEGRYEVAFVDWQYQEIANDLYSDRFTFDEPVETQYLSVMILDAQEGAKYKDTCLTELALWGYVEETKQAENAAADYAALYDNLRTQAADAFGSDCEYALYDMDHDGTVELIVSWGTCDADWTNTVYTVEENGQLIEVGGFSGMVSLYAAENGDGIYSVYGHSGYQQVEWVTKNGNSLSVETILSEETENYYENDSPILMVGIDEEID